MHPNNEFDLVTDRLPLPYEYLAAIEIMTRGSDLAHPPVMSQHLEQLGVRQCPTCVLHIMLAWTWINAARAFDGQKPYLQPKSLWSLNEAGRDPYQQPN